MKFIFNLVGVALIVLTSAVFSDLLNNTPPLHRHPAWWMVPAYGVAAAAAITFASFIRGKNKE